MEFVYSLGEHQPAELPFPRFGEAASVARRTAIKGNCMNHAFAVEEVMPKYRLEQKVAILEVKSFDAIRDGPGDRKIVTDRLQDQSGVSVNLNAAEAGVFMQKIPVGFLDSQGSTIGGAGIGEVC